MPVAEKFKTASLGASMDPQQPVLPLPPTPSLCPPGSEHLPSIHPPPGLGLACHIKFKGFKCKYFSFIDASCLQRAHFLAAQLYCPISFPYLGTGEPGGLWREGGWLPRPPWSWKLPPPTLGPVSGVGWGALGHREGAPFGFWALGGAAGAGGVGAVSGYSSIKT